MRARRLNRRKRRERPGKPTAFLFPCTTGLLSRVVPSGERGLFLGVQQAFGGLTRVIFPLWAGWAMDAFGRGVPFAVGAVMVLATLPLALGVAVPARVPA